MTDNIVVWCRLLFHWTCSTAVGWQPIFCPHVTCISKVNSIIAHKHHLRTTICGALWTTSKLVHWLAIVSTQCSCRLFFLWGQVNGRNQIVYCQRPKNANPVSEHIWASNAWISTVSCICSLFCLSIVNKDYIVLNCSSVLVHHYGLMCKFHFRFHSKCKFY